MKFLTIVGARPQFIKCAPVSRELRQIATEVLVHTGQHYDAMLSDVFFRELSIPAPNYHLDVGSGPHGSQTAKMLERIEQVLIAESPDVCIVYGDTNSTLAGALAAGKLRIPLAHIEAGLRSFNRDMPEEINRIITDHLSDICLCPTEESAKNLSCEGISNNVYVVGDVMFDAFRHNSAIALEQSDILSRLHLEPKQFILATVHRAENTDRIVRLSEIFESFQQLAATGQRVVVPIHPRTAPKLASLSLNSHPNLQLIDPVGYLDMLCLERHARTILTDSGGVQKEAYWCRVPCVTLREQSEWGETIRAGWNVLVGANAAEIVRATTNASAPDHTIPEWETHQASCEIAHLLMHQLPRPYHHQAKVA